MDIGVDRIDNVQDSYEADKQNQPPSQQPNLGFAFLKLTVRLFIGYCNCPRYPPAKRFQRLIKSDSVGAFLQFRTQFRISVRSCKAGVNPVTDQNLNAIYKSTVAHTEIVIIAAHGQQYRQPFPGHGNLASFLHMGCAKGYPIDFHGDGISYYAPFSCFQHIKLPFRQPGSEFMIHPAVIKPKDLKRFANPQHNISFNPYGPVLFIQLVEGKLLRRHVIHIFFQFQRFFLLR